MGKFWPQSVTVLQEGAFKGVIKLTWIYLLLWFSCSVMSNFATPWLQHARLPCPSLSPGVCSNWCPLTQWWYPTIYVAPSPLALNLSKHQGLLVSLYKGEIWTQTVKREDRVKTPGCLKASEETNPVDILILDFQPSVELWKKIHCCCLSHLVYDTLLWQSWQINT